MLLNDPIWLRYTQHRVCNEMISPETIRDEDVKQRLIVTPEQQQQALELAYGPDLGNPPATQRMVSIEYDLDHPAAPFAEMAKHYSIKRIWDDEDTQYAFQTSIGFDESKPGLIKLRRNMHTAMIQVLGLACLTYDDQLIVYTKQARNKSEEQKLDELTLSYLWALHKIGENEYNEDGEWETIVGKFTQDWPGTPFYIADTRRGGAQDF